MANRKYDAEEFYPTPLSLLEKMTENLDWKKVGSVLEPSAGKGNIAEFCKERYRTATWERDPDIDCIEIDDELRSVLKGKELRVVHDDFLTFHTHKHYDLIIMNPPFGQGARHLLKALDLMEDGFGVICILNAETLRNPYTNERKALVQRLQDLDAKIEYIQNAFSDSEHPTDVEIALVRVFVPYKERESLFYEELRKKNYGEYVEEETTDPIPGEYIRAAVQMYELETEAGIRLIQEYKAMCPYMISDLRNESFQEAILTMKVQNRELSVNAYVRAVRRKYWNALFQNPHFTGKMTSNLATQYYHRVEELSDYDFSYYNIKTIQSEMSRNLIRGIEDCIVELFDTLSAQYSYYDETSKNIHYYNGWKTNKSWYINKKVILPFMNAFSAWSGRFSPGYEAKQKLCDIEKALNYLDGGLTDSIDLYDVLRSAENNGQTRKIRLKYFYVSFYKKGTCHIEFTNMDLLKKLNIFGSQQKKWLPPGYGKRSYREMDAAEKEVVDSFEGAESYRRTCANAGYFIYNPASSVKLLEASVADAA